LWLWFWQVLRPRWHLPVSAGPMDTAERQGRRKTSQSGRKIDKMYVYISNFEAHSSE